MVLKLSDFCLFSVRDSIKNGLMTDVTQVGPKLRQRILEYVSGGGMLNNANCIRALSTPEFLQDMTSLNLEDGCVNDREYLNSVAKSMCTKLDNGETIGQSIKEVKLNVYAYQKDEYGTGDLVLINLKSMTNMISKCTRLRSLSLKYCFMNMEEDIPIDQRVLIKQPDGPLLTNEALKECLPILNNLQDLTLKTGRKNPVFFDAHTPVDQFKKLNSFSVHQITLIPDAWYKLENAIRASLTNLVMEYPQVCSSERDEGILVLQKPFPHLKSLDIRSKSSIRVNLESLKTCPRLEHAHIPLWDETVSVKDVEILSGIPNVTATFNGIGMGGGDYSKLAWLERIRDKITGLQFNIQWTDEFARMLEKVLNECLNLERLEFLQAVNIVEFDENGDGHPALPESETTPGWIKSTPVLLAFFSNPKRASKIRHLFLSHDLDEGVMNAIFDNCINIHSLTALNCVKILDHHMIEWSRRGAKPSEICIVGAQDEIRVTEKGILPVLVNSGEKLRDFAFNAKRDLWDRIWPMLATHCRFVKIIHAPTKCDDVLATKFFKIINYVIE